MADSDLRHKAEMAKMEAKLRETEKKAAGRATSELSLYSSCYCTQYCNSLLCDTVQLNRFISLDELEEKERVHTEALMEVEQVGLDGG